MSGCVSKLPGVGTRRAGLDPRLHDQHAPPAPPPSMEGGAFRNEWKRPTLTSLEQQLLTNELNLF